MPAEKVPWPESKLGKAAMTCAMPTYERVYEFLKQHYRRERFEGYCEDTPGWGKEYAACVARSTYNSLHENGYSCISRHEDSARRGFFFGRDLVPKE